MLKSSGVSPWERPSINTTDFGVEFTSRRALPPFSETSPVDISESIAEINLRALESEQSSQSSLRRIVASSKKCERIAVKSQPCPVSIILKLNV